MTKPPGSVLSPREYTVLHLLAEGLTEQQVAARLYLSVNTIKTYTKNIRKKLQASNGVECVARGYELGVLVRMTPGPATGCCQHCQAVRAALAEHGPGLHRRLLEALTGPAA